MKYIIPLIILTLTACGYPYHVRLYNLYEVPFGGVWRPARVEVE